MYPTTRVSGLEPNNAAVHSTASRTSRHLRTSLPRAHQGTDLVGKRVSVYIEILHREGCFSMCATPLCLRRRGRKRNFMRPKIWSKDGVDEWTAL
jgi:hypothetical protein